MVSQSNNLQHVNFLNGVYYGNLRAEKCHGRGVFLWDSGEFYFGEWEQNKMHGEGIFFFAYGGVLKGQFYRSKINGAAILKFPNGDVYEGFWRHGKLDGKCFKYFQKDKTWALCIYENGIYKKYLNRGKGTPNMSHNLILYQSYQTKIDFEEKLTDSIEISFLGDQEKYIGMLPFTDGGKYYGVIENETANGLGLTSHTNGKNDIGFYQEGIIAGLGRLSFSEGSFYDGDLKQGQLEGEGFFYKKDSNKWVFGKFHDGKCTSVEKKGSGIPVEEIKKWKASHRGQNTMPTFKHVLNNVFSVPVLEITKKKLPTQRFIGLKKTVRNLSPVKENSQIIIDINKVLENVPFNQQPQSVLPSFRQQHQEQENKNENENNTLEILIENESIEDQQPEKKMTTNESISQGHMSKLSICIQDNIEKNLDFFSAAAAQQISHEEPKRSELPPEGLKNSLKTRTGRNMANSAKTPPPKTNTEIISKASLSNNRNSAARKNSKGPFIKSSQTRNSADYQTPKAKIKPNNKDPQTTIDKTQEDTLDLDFHQSPLFTREDKSDLENFLDETAHGHLSNIISTTKSLQELNHKQSPRSELLKEKTDQIIPTNEEVMSFGRAGSGDGFGSGSGSRSRSRENEENHEEEYEEYDYTQNSHQSYERSPASAKIKENPNIMVNDIISKALQINDDGLEIIGPLTEMKRSYSVDYGDGYHEILSSQDVPFENSDYIGGLRHHSRSKSVGISRIDLRNSRLEKIPEETSQPATSNRENIFLASESLRSLHSRRSPNLVVQGEEDASDHPLNLKQVKTSYSISVNGDGDRDIGNKNLPAESAPLRQENPQVSKNSPIQVSQSSLPTPNHHHVESFNLQGTTPVKTILENKIHDTTTKVPEFILRPSPASETNVITTERPKRERSYEEQNSKEVHNLIDVYLDSSTKKNPRSASPPLRRVQYSPDTNKLVQSYSLSKESDQTQIQGKTFNTSASQSNFYMRFSNFTRYNNLSHSKTQESGDYFEVITSEGDYDSLKPIKERKYRECHVEGVRYEDSEIDYSVNSDPSQTLFDKLMNRYMKAAQSPPKGSTMFEKNYDEYSQNGNLIKDLSLSNLDNQHPNNLEISDIAFLSNNFSPFKNQQGSIDDLSLLKDNQNKFTSTAADEETLASKNNTSGYPINMSSLQRSSAKIYAPKFGTPSSLAEPVQEASQVNGRSSPMSLPNNMKSNPQSTQYFQTTSIRPQMQMYQHETKSFNPQFLATSPKSRDTQTDTATQQKIEEIKREALAYKKSSTKGFTFLDNIEGRHRAASPDHLSPDYRSDDDIMEPPTLGAQKAFKGTPKKFDSKFLFSSPFRKSNYP